MCKKSNAEAKPSLVAISIQPKQSQQREIKILSRFFKSKQLYLPILKHLSRMILILRKTCQNIQSFEQHISQKPRSQLVERH